MELPEKQPWQLVSQSSTPEMDLASTPLRYGLGLKGLKFEIWGLSFSLYHLFAGSLRRVHHRERDRQAGRHQAGISWRSGQWEDSKIPRLSHRKVSGRQDLLCFTGCGQNEGRNEVISIPHSLRIENLHHLCFCVGRHQGLSHVKKSHMGREF